MTRDEALLEKRVVDLSRQAQHKNIAVFSDFLNLNELNIFHRKVPELCSGFALSGGYERSERQMIAFLPDALYYTWEYPVSCLYITPVNRKFAETLSHRDVLGSLMALGIERAKLGDILIEEDGIYVFCHEKIAPYILEQLTRIRNTTVSVKTVVPDGLRIEPRYERCGGIVASNRLDGILACICNIPRSQASEWIRSGKVFINHRETLRTDFECKPQDLISVRSVGRFSFLGSNGETKKGRIKIQYDKYL